jgi:hypothetical protein
MLTSKYKSLLVPRLVIDHTPLPPTAVTLNDLVSDIVDVGFDVGCGVGPGVGVPGIAVGCSVG